MWAKDGGRDRVSLHACRYVASHLTHDAHDTIRQEAILVLRRSRDLCVVGQKK